MPSPRRATGIGNPGGPGVPAAGRAGHRHRPRSQRADHARARPNAALNRALNRAVDVYAGDPFFRAPARCPAWSRARRGRRVESGDRRAVVRQCEHCRLPFSEDIQEARRHLADPAGQRTARPTGLGISRIRSASGSVPCTLWIEQVRYNLPNPVAMSRRLSGNRRRARRPTGMTRESVDSTAVPRSALCKWKQSTPHQA